MRVLALCRVDAVDGDGPGGDPPGDADPAAGPLDRLRYSRYKYGQVAEISAFGRELTALALGELPQLADPAEAAGVTVTAPASRAVPIGADLLADAVLRGANRVRAGLSLAPAVRAKLHRYEVPSVDYGAKDLLARRALLADERISSIRELFTDRHVLVVDDLWVTGTSAEVTAAAIDTWLPASLTYLVIARVGERYAAAHPEAEADLNHAAVDGLPALAGLLRQGPVIVNQRLCKFVMRRPAGELSAWLPAQQPEWLWRLFHAALAEGFGLMPEFRDSYRVLSRLVDRERLDERAAGAGWSAAPDAYREAADTPAWAPRVSSIAITVPR